MQGATRHALTLLRDGETSLDQADLDSDEYVVAGVGEIGRAKENFLRSLPNTKVGLAIRAKRVRSHRVKKALRNRKSDSWIEENVRQDFFSRLPAGPTVESHVRFDSEWLSETRVMDATGLTFTQLAELDAAGCQMVYLASKEDLADSERAVHHYKESIYLDRAIPKNRSEASKEWTYFGEGDSYVPREELQPSKDRPTYEGEGNGRPEPMDF